MLLKMSVFLTFACAGLPGQEQKVDCSCLKAACLCFFSTSCLLRSSFSSRISASNLLPWDAACIWKQTVPGRGLPSTRIPGNSHNPPVQKQENESAVAAVCCACCRGFYRRLSRWDDAANCGAASVLFTLGFFFIQIGPNWSASIICRV